MALCEEDSQIDELCCPICQETYDDDEQSPRNIPCGHTICSHCLNLILEEYESLCPECRTPIPNKRLEGFPISYIVKKMLQSYKSIYTKIQNEALLSVVQHTNTSHTKAKSVASSVARNEGASSVIAPSKGFCSDHQSPRSFFCCTHDSWICGACAFLKHKNELNCKVEFANGPLAVAKIEIFNEIKIQKSNLKLAISKLEKFKKTTLELYSKGKAPQEDVRNINAIVHSNSKNVREILDSYELLEEIEGDIKGENDIEKSKVIFENLWQCQCFPKGVEDLIWNFWPTIKLSIDCFDSRQHKTCATYQTEDGRKLYSEVVATNDYILFTSLTVNPTDKDAFAILSLDHLIDGKKFEYGYMEFCSKTELDYLGRIIFIFLENDSRCQNFMWLCLGVLGDCYRGTHLLAKTGANFRFLEGGDYENDDGTGGRSVINFMDNRKVIRDLTEGMICGPPSILSTASQFKICFDLGSYGSYARGEIAQIVEGYDIIKEIVEMDHVNEIYIRECGVCLKREEDHSEDEYSDC